MSGGAGEAYAAGPKYSKTDTIVYTDTRRNSTMCKMFSSFRYAILPIRKNLCPEATLDKQETKVEAKTEANTVCTAQS
jgi:hypothetical protein